MITYTTAELMGAEEVPTSRKNNKLAAAFNDRLRWGPDCTWRVWWKAYSMFRQLRTDEGALSPAQDEWYSHFMHVKPEEGAPLEPYTAAHRMVEFVYGRDSSAIPSEAGRMNLIPGGASNTPAEQWALGKAQRGCISPVTGAHNAPAFEASIAHWGIYRWASARDALSAYHNYPQDKFFATYGGFLGAPLTYGNGTTQRIFFSLRGQAHKVYVAGSESGDLASIDYAVDHYHLHWHGGASETLSYADWIEGPYRLETVLQKRPGWQLNEILCRYVSSFRGSDAQRTGNDWRINDIGFDTDRFFNSQYLLAPAYGIESGGNIDAVYPFYKWNVEEDGEAMPGSALYHSLGMQHYQFQSGFVFAGFLITPTNLEQDFNLSFRDKNTGAEIHQATVNQFKPSLFYFDTATCPDLEIVLLKDPLTQGSITVECAELEAYRPDMADAAVLLRRLTTKGPEYDPCDTRGNLDSNAKEHSESYFAKGCIATKLELEELPGNDINASPVYEAARTMLRNRLRLVKRLSFTDYTEAGGKAVLTFDRYLMLSGTRLDLFEGIAPPDHAIASGELLSGVLYRVKGTGSVSYQGVTYTDGQEFTAVNGDYSFTSANGGEVWQVEGIIRAAPEWHGTNEWLLFMSFNGWDSSESDYWKEETYGDPLAMLHNRCMTFSPKLDPVTGDQELATHITYNQDFGGESPRWAAVAEAPSGWNYVRGMNVATAPDTFWKSCPLYPRDYEIESARMNGDQVVITLTGPLRKAEENAYRSDDNGLLDYLAYIKQGIKHAPRTGDMAVGAGDDFNHCCAPRFYFTKLFEKARTDEPDNDTYEKTDTRSYAEPLQDMGFFLDAMCEGYIDLLASPMNGCYRLPNYEFEALCWQALGKRWLPLLPTGGEDYQGFGPVPMMKPYADHFNNLVKCVNRLVWVPIELPFPMQVRKKWTVGKRAIAANRNFDPDAVPPPSLIGRCAYAEVGSPEAGYQWGEGHTVILMDDTYPAEGEYEDSDWGPWKDYGTEDMPSTQLTVQGGPSWPGPLVWEEQQPPGYASGYGAAGLMIQGWAGGGGTSYKDIVTEGGNCFLATAREHCQLRFNAASPAWAALSQEIRDLLGGSGSIHFIMQIQQDWHTNDGPTNELSCGFPDGEEGNWWDNVLLPDFRPQARTANEFACLELPLTSGFLAGDPGSEIDFPTPKLQDSLVGVWTGAKSPDVGVVHCYRGAKGGWQVSEQRTMGLSVPLV